MRLKKLEIYGFKSFMERTTFTFEPGITAVVGPNGCGKSNIVDAIRWVMGEQSAKALRGRSMEDVIFNGSDDHPAMGMTEVILTLENTNGSVPQHLAQFTEIEISRRLFRSGESEYAINRIPCRRRDVWEFFMDTGLGARSYAIVEQDRVAKIIHAKPQERRQIIDDVAGISKYKARREAAQRKLEATKQNLLRIKDIILEVETNLKALERQAKRAQRYKDIKERLLLAERRIRLHQWLELFGMARELKLSIEALESERDALQHRANIEEAELERRRLEVIELEKEAEQCGKNRALWDERIRELENRSLSCRKEMQATEEISRLLSQEIRDIEGRLSLLKKRRSEAVESIKEIEGKKSYIIQQISIIEDALAEKNKAFEELSDMLTARKRDLVEWISQRAALKNALENMDRRKREMEKALQRYRGQHHLLQRELKDHREKMGSIQGRLGALDIKNKDLERIYEVLEGELRDRQARLSVLSERAEGIRLEIARVTARLKSLKEIQGAMEDFSRGVRDLFAAYSRGELLRGRELRIVAQVMDAAPSYLDALEGALGDKLQYFILEQWDELLEALQFVKKRGIGRVGFVVRSGLGEEKMERPKDQAASGGLGAHVSWQSGCEWVGERLLGDFHLVEDLGSLKDLHNSLNERHIVTIDGVVVDPRGLAEGGGKRGSTKAYLQRKKEIESLESRARQLEEEEESLTKDVNHERSEIEELQERMKKIEAERGNIQRMSAEANRDLNALNGSITNLTERIEVLEFDIKEGEEELTQLGRNYIQYNDELATIEARIKMAEGEVLELEQKREQLEKELAGQQEALTQKKVQLASLMERLESTNKEIGSIIETEEELRQQMEEKSRRIEENTQRNSMLAAQLEEIRVEMRECMERHAQVKEEADQVDIALSEKRAKIHQLESSLNSLRGELGRLSQRLQGQLLEHREVSLRMEHLEEELTARLGMQKDSIHQYAQEARDLDIEEEKSRIKGLRSSLESLGEVNLVAAQQYEEMKARYEYLSSQKEDLELSIKGLNKAIQRIDRTSRRKFRRAFAAVDEQFKRVFPVLFGGGEARLELTDSDDVLEAGVEIIARPPGKRLQNLSLMSGGEKALTAVALIFATLMIRPVPFCLLDEVDAPLDDANIDRFIHMVKELSKGSQFILVTHNKRTMEMADVLYGITMETPGISKLISVKFN